jgi:CHAT domain-containing protein
MAQSSVVTADRRHISAMLDGLAEEISNGPTWFGSEASQDELAALQGIAELAARARAAILDRDSADPDLGSLAAAISDLATLRFEAGALGAALKLDRWVLSIRQGQDNRPCREIASALQNLARDHFHLGAYAAAARFAEEALSLASETLPANDPGLPPFLVTLAGAYEQTGRLEQARSQVQRALALAEANFGAADHRLVPALQLMASIHRAMGRIGEAYLDAERALTIERQTMGEASVHAARAAGQLAGIVAQIGDKPRARTLFEQALEILQRLPASHAVRHEIATILASLAGLAEPGDAIRLYEDALALRQSVSGADHPESIRVLSHLALVYCQHGENAKALAIWDECLARRRRLDGVMHPDVARSLIDVAYPLWRLGDTARATRALLEAIAILACYDMPGVAARAHSLLASIVEKASLAAGIFFAKQVVNTLQDLRAEANSDAADRAFVGSREQSYRQLGNGLLVSGRLPEAQQALEMLKETELFAIMPRHLDPRVTRASLTPLEMCWAERAAVILERTKARFALMGRDQNGCSAPEDHASSAGLEQLLTQAVAELEQWFESLRAAFRQTEFDAKAATEPDPTPRQSIPPGTALLQYLLAGDRLKIILTTSDLIRHYDTRFRRYEMHRLVFSMRTALQQGSNDFLGSAQRLYEILIAPAAAELRAGGIRTLALSLDGVLRYLPLAALHDGTRYLLEDYALILSTGRANAEPNHRQPALRASGLGVTRAIPPHQALQGVREELMAVIRTADNEGGVLPGVIRLDEAFTAKALDEALSAGFPVIHIASHFAFHTAQEADSYLLLGDGSKLTLADLARLNFAGVELIVFSACDTAAGGGHGQSGREIEGLGTLARHQGARNVIATLWPVRDLTAAILMRRFYQNCFQRGLSLPEGLRQAQLSLRNTPAGEDTAAARTSRAVVPADDEDEHPVRWDHPRYWAPYLLMGDAWARSSPA